MFGLGIYTTQQYLGMGAERRFVGPRVAYNLLLVGENPSEEQIRLFEDISITLRTSNGTFRTTFRDRFLDVDACSVSLMGQYFQPASVIRIEDRAMSHGLTSCEWARRLLPAFPNAQIEASDLLLELLELSTGNGEVFVTETDGTPLQYIKPPCVVSIYHRESRRNPLRCWIAARARRRFARLGLPDGWTEQSKGKEFEVRRIPFIHPEAAALARSDPRFIFRRRSVFERSAIPCDVVRTMNIFNLDYFTPERLREGFQSIFASLTPGGIWVAGRTHEQKLSNHATFFRKSAAGWLVLDRIGGGWDLEAMALESL